MSAVRKFLALPRRERGLLLAALAGLPLVAAGVRLLGYRRMCGLLSTGVSVSADPSENYPDEVARLARAVRRAARHGPVRGTCLSRALLLWRMLLRRGIPAEIRFGVRGGGTSVEAHAWVVTRERSLDDGFEAHEFADLLPARPDDIAAP